MARPVRSTVILIEARATSPAAPVATTSAVRGPAAAALARHPRLHDPLARVLGPGAGVVRGLYFDKPPGDGWALPWHRDTTVAVKAHGRFGTFVKPTTKAGVPHVEAVIA